MVKKLLPRHKSNCINHKLIWLVVICQKNSSWVRLIFFTRFKKFDESCLTCWWRWSDFHSDGNIVAKRTKIQGSLDSIMKGELRTLTNMRGNLKCNLLSKEFGPVFLFWAIWASVEVGYGFHLVEQYKIFLKNQSKLNMMNRYLTLRDDKEVLYCVL